MSSGTAIEWTDATWNPVVGCTRVSAGCDHCYAVKASYRLEQMGQKNYAGLTVLNGRGERHFNGVVRTVADALAKPLSWKKPRRVFVNSMSDLFHKDVPFEFIDQVFAVMALCPQHTFQVLTKRPERIAEYLSDQPKGENFPGLTIKGRMASIWLAADEMGGVIPGGELCYPFPNVWIGTSCEDQQAADERIPHLLKFQAAVRFLSCEPLLGAIDLSRIRHGFDHDLPMYADWVIVGGESGPGARVCDVAWVRSIVKQCAAASVPCFVKQLGAKPEDNNGGELARYATINDPKGGDIDEWPADLRVREWPK